jgi:hypothetical protein
LGRFAAAGPAAAGSGGRFAGKRHDAHQVFAQRVGVDLLEFLADVAIIRESSSSEASARMVKPVRTWPALKSIEPMVQAVVSIFSTVGLIAGVRRCRT